MFSLIGFTGCKEGTGLLEAKPSSSSSSSSSSGGSSGGGGSTIGFHSNNATFEFVKSTITSGSTSSVNMIATLPSPTSPAIDTSSMVTAISTPTNPTLAKIVPQPISGSISSNNFSMIDITATQLSHDYTMDDDVGSSCSSTKTLVCDIDSGDASILNLSEIDMSEFDITTTQFSLTVDGNALNAPAKPYEVKKLHTCSATGATYAYWANEVVYLDGYYYVIGLTSVSGSIYNDLFRFSSTDGTGEELTRSVSVNVHKMKNLSAFNGKIYYTANEANGEYYFFQYDPSSNTHTNLSTASGDLREPQSFTLWNSKLFFAARDSSDAYQLYSLDSSGNIKQYTDVCSGGSTKSMERLIPTSNGLYMGITDPAACSNHIVGRLNNDGSFTPLTSAASTTTTTGLLKAKVHNGVTYFNAGYTGGETLYRDNMDGSVDLMTPQAFSSYESTNNVGDFDIISDQLYYKNNGNSGPLYRLDLTTGLIHILLNSVNLYQVNYVSEMILFNGYIYFAAKDTSNYNKLFRITTTDNNIEQVANTSGASDDPQKLQILNNELWFKVKKSGGGWTVRKIDTNLKIKTLFDANYQNLFVTEAGALIGMTSGMGYDQYFIQAQ